MSAPTATEWLTLFQSFARNRRKVRRAARVAVGNALRDGRIHRPAACARCGGHHALEAHHRTYGGDGLDIEWLCDRCHRQAHRHTESYVTEFLLERTAS